MKGVAAVALVAAFALAGTAASAASAVDCAAPNALTAIAVSQRLPAARLAQHEGLTIVAIGSSSTEGIGASSPAASYPSRLEIELRRHYPEGNIRVLNRGIGGEDAPEELARLDRTVGADHPDLVIWQVGTNAVLRRDDLAADDHLIERGVALLKGSGIDVVLMDLQYAPGVLARPAYAEMETRIANIANGEHVGLFRRFALMERWNETHQLGDAAMIGTDGLHMTDASYACLATDLADALARNWGAAGAFAAASSPAEKERMAGLDRHRSAPVATEHDRR